MLKARAAVQQVPEYHPPLAGRSGIRLDFNENTDGCSPRVLARLRALDFEDLAKYPERHEVECSVAKFLGVDAAQVLLTNGVDEAVHLLCQTYLDPGDEVLIPVPTFSMYEIYAAAAGARAVTVPAGRDFQFPGDAMLAAITPRTRMIAVATPNNPTGTVAPEAALLKLAAAAPHAAVLVDEAYFEFYGRTMLPCLATAPNLFVARTFSKVYGMAGLRAGVLVGSAAQMTMVRRVASPYNVNAVALACIPEALADVEHVASYVAQVRRGRSRLEANLEKLGIEFWPSEANFVLMNFGEHRVAFIDAMKRRGILVRDRHRDPGCAGCVRMTLGTDKQNEAAFAALKAALEEIGWKKIGHGKRLATDETDQH